MGHPKKIDMNEARLGTDLLKLLNNFFPKLIPSLKEMPDWRDERYITYPHYYLLFLLIGLFLFRQKARSEISKELNSDHFIANINAFLNLNLETVSHGDTCNNYLLKFESDNLKELPYQMTNFLIRKRCFEKLRFMNKYYLIAIDGSGIATFKESLSGKELIRKQKDGTHCYLHYVLEAKMVFKNGIVASVGSEVIENQNPEFDKQDCEINGAKRLIPQLKKKFPCLPVCGLLDGLFSNDPIITIFEKNKWMYFITLKDGSLKTVHEDYRGLLELQLENHIRNGNVDLYWVNDIQYKSHTLSIIEGIEPDPDHPGKTKKFMFITNFIVTKQNVAELYFDGAKQRFKIENENFNFQKNDMNFKHLYSTKYEVIKSLYYLLQVAHLIFLVFIYGFYAEKKKVKKIFGTLTKLAIKILESIISYPVSDFNIRMRLSIV